MRPEERSIVKPHPPYCGSEVSFGIPDEHGAKPPPPTRAMGYGSIRIACI